MGDRIEDDLNLADVLGFIGASRKNLAIGMAAGLFLSVSIWLWKKNSPSPLPATRFVQAAVLLPELSDLAVPASPAVLNIFIKTSGGARAFAEGIKNSAVGKDFDAEMWATNQINGSGILRSFDPIEDGKFIVTVEPLESWSESDLKSALFSGVNSLIDKYNEISLPSKKIQENIDQDLLSIKAEIAALTLEALKYIDSKSGIQTEIQRSLVSGITSTLATDLRPDALLLAIATISDESPQKNILMAKYQNILKKFESIRMRNKILSKSYVGELSFPTERLKGSFSVVTKNGNLTPLPSRQNIYVLIAVGLISGFLVGLVAALIQLYWRKNSLIIKRSFNYYRKIEN